MNSGEHFEATWGNLPDLAGHELKGTFTGNMGGNLPYPAGHELRGTFGETWGNLQDALQDMNSGTLRRKLGKSTRLRRT